MTVSHAQTSFETVLNFLYLFFERQRQLGARETRGRADAGWGPIKDRRWLGLVFLMLAPASAVPPPPWVT